MKNLKIYLIGAMALGMFACGGGSQETTTETEENVVESTKTAYSIDAASSTVNWKGGVVGGAYGHSGVISLKEGSLEIENGAIVGGTFTVDMTTINPTDSSYSEENPRENLIGHLMTADFFDVENNPTASFVVKSFEGNALTGDLTIRGKTVEEKIENVTINEADGTVTASGQLVFNRQNFDVAYQSTMKDIVISDDIEIAISLTGKSN